MTHCHDRRFTTARPCGDSFGGVAANWRFLLALDDVGSGGLFVEPIVEPGRITSRVSYQTVIGFSTT
jgi:hypothetical protein